MEVKQTASVDSQYELKHLQSIVCPHAVFVFNWNTLLAGLYSNANKATVR